MRSRREFLQYTVAGLSSAVLARSVSAANPTPSTTDGPFYPTSSMRFSDDDSDLVRISDEVVDAGGEIVLLVGRVTDQASAPIEAARVEIWQCDVNGRYLHSGDRGGKARDAAFQGFGYSVADADGRYSFRTIKPVPYPGRTPHIHVKVLAGNRELTTQFYNAGEPRNQNDSLYNWLSDEDKRAVEMRFALLNNVPSARVDIVL